MIFPAINLHKPGGFPADLAMFEDKGNPRRCRDQQQTQLLKAPTLPAEDLVTSVGTSGVPGSDGWEGSGDDESPKMVEPDDKPQNPIVRTHTILWRDI